MKSSTCSFAFGQTLITPGARAVLGSDEVLGALARHARGDWGNCDPEDWAANDHAVSNGSRLLSVYESSQGTPKNIKVGLPPRTSKISPC